MVLPVRIELTTSPLPRGCSTTELRQPRRSFQAQMGDYTTARPVASRAPRDRPSLRRAVVSERKPRHRVSREILLTMEGTSMPRLPVSVVVSALVLLILGACAQQE